MDQLGLSILMMTGVPR
uniref:Uncharacterized protein n=1 Tax=Arundo donax TaxID=35708 RepID=A0A0A9FJ32_ARUDO